jgi:hypothetical protein
MTCALHIRVLHKGESSTMCREAHRAPLPSPARTVNVTPMRVDREGEAEGETRRAAGASEATTMATASGPAQDGQGRRKTRWPSPPAFSTV